MIIIETNGPKIIHPKVDENKPIVTIWLNIFH